MRVRVDGRRRGGVPWRPRSWSGGTWRQFGRRCEEEELPVRWTSVRDEALWIKLCLVHRGERHGVGHGVDTKRVAGNATPESAVWGHEGEWREEWTLLSPADRTEVRRAVRRGEAVDNAEYAVLAVELARRRQDATGVKGSWGRVVQVVLSVFWLVYGVWSIATGVSQHRVIAVAVGVVGLLLSYGWLAVIPRQHRRAVQAETANQLLVSGESS